MKYYAIGTPIGVINETEKQHFYVDGHMLAIDSNAYQVWLQFLQGNTLEKAIAIEQQRQSVHVNQMSTIFNELLKTGLLASADSLNEHIPHRQGYGIGYSARQKTSIIYNGERCQLSYGAYVFWAYCDGRRKCAEIIQGLPKEIAPVFTPEQTAAFVDELLRYNLLVFDA